MTIFRALTRHISRYPERDVIKVPGHASLNGTAVWHGAARFAAALHAIGISAGDRVLVKLPKSVEGVLLYLGVLRLGAVYVPVSPDITLPELLHVVGDADPKLFVCDEADLNALNGSGPAIVTAALSHLAASGVADVEVVTVGAKAPAAILYTSGTTGRPKGAVLSHGNLLANAEALVAAWEIKRADVLLHALPVYHTHGLFVALNTLLMAGGQILLLPRFSCEQVYAHLAQATLFMGVPTFYTRLLEAPAFDGAAWQRLRLAVSGSAPLPPPVWEAFFKETGCAILERYGMTETGILASNPLHGTRKPGSVGRPLPGVDLRIDDGGKVQVKGKNVTDGYWRQPAKTAAAFTKDGYFRTGDLGRLDADGYLFLLGRESDLIITGGLNVCPAEVEAELLALTQVKEAAIFGVPHADFGEAVVAAVVCTAPCSDAEHQIRVQLQDRLSAFKHPKAVIVMEALPRNALGKVEKRILRQRYQSLF